MSLEVLLERACELEPERFEPFGKAVNGAPCYKVRHEQSWHTIRTWATSSFPMLLAAVQEAIKAHQGAYKLEAQYTKADGYWHTAVVNLGWKPRVEMSKDEVVALLSAYLAAIEAVSPAKQ